MASVEEIVDRLAKEDPLYGIYRPGLGTSRTQMIKVVQSTSEKEVADLNWLPNRKVVSGVVAGGIAWAAMRFLGVEVDPEISSAITLLVVSGISYLVPLPKDPES